MRTTTETTTAQWAQASALAKIIGISASTIKRRRQEGALIKGIHWQKLSYNTILYNVPLMVDWVQNADDPHRHQIEIERYLKEVAS